MGTIFDYLIDPAEPRHRPRPGVEPAYRYVSREGLLTYLAPTGMLRMNSWANMNDPRETRSWKVTGPFVTTGSLTRADVVARVDHLLRRSARLLSTSLDRDPPESDSTQYLFHRGWANGPMWSHYAGAHTGACLVLDLGELHAQLDELPAGSSQRWRGIGRVEYTDSPAQVQLAGDLATIADVDHAVDASMDRRNTVVALHLQKALDWSYENEARLISVNFDLPRAELDTALYLPIGQALKAVVLGEDHDNPAASAAQLRTQLNHHDLAVAHCIWSGGMPELRVL